MAGTIRGGLTIRQASADLPAFDEETSLEAVSSLGTEGGQICDFQFGDVSVPTLEVRNVQLLSGKIRAVQAGRASITAARIDSVEFTGCDLAGSLFDDCDLRLAGFGPGSYRGCDLRGNDLSAISGAHHLKNVVIDHAQTIQLAQALAAELDVTFGDDLSDRAEQP